MKISLVVPVKNEEKSLPDLFESIERQMRKPDEMVFVDGGSTDKTVELLERFCRRNPEAKLIKETEATPGRGRNIGVENSSHNWIAFTDAGIKLEENWLLELEKTALIENAEIVYGHYEVNKESEFTENYEIAVVTPPQIINDAPIRHHFTASTLVKKELFQKVGGFPDLRAAEDRIFLKKADELAAKVAFCSKAIVVWSSPSNYREVWNRFYLYSFHGIKAGEFDNWHKGVYKTYFGSFLIIVASLIFPPIFLALFLVIFLRVKKRFSRNGKSIDSSRFLQVAGILFLTDLTAFAGHLKSFFVSR